MTVCCLHDKKTIEQVLRKNIYLNIYGIEDLDEILEFYHQSYPGNWFDPRMLESKQYFGARVDGALVSMAGIHVYSEKYRVAALGNIATMPSYRNRG